MASAEGETGLRSMTGFGSARSVDAAPLRLEVEARSVNHRHLKVSVRVPEGLNSLAPKVEQMVRSTVGRGTVYLTVRQSTKREEAGWQLDRALLVRLHRELTLAADDLGVAPPTLGEIATLPGVVHQDDVLPEAAAMWPEVEGVVGKAIAQLDAMRRQEGEGIAADIVRLTEEMCVAADAIEVRLPLAVQEHGNRLKQRIAQLVADHPDAEGPGLAREIALLADKTDVSEELQRLRSHVKQVRETLDGSRGPVGRKLEFLAQELLRESNTMASKSHDTELVNHVLELKLAVERIREQVANVE